MKRLFFLCLFISISSFAASLKGTADSLGNEAINIGIALGVFAIAVAGTLLALGKQEGGQRITQAIFGIIIVLIAKTLITTLRGVVGGA